MKTYKQFKEAINGIKLGTPKPFIVNVEKETINNALYRKVLYTGPTLQLVLMSLKPGEEIGEEVHKKGDQFIRVDGGTAAFVLGGKSTNVGDGYATIVPEGMKHNIINVGNDDLKLYIVYGPPEHEEGLEQKNKPQE